MSPDWLDHLDFHAKLYTSNPEYRRAYDRQQHRIIRRERWTLTLHWITFGVRHDWRTDTNHDLMYCRWCPARRSLPTGTD